MLNNVDSEFSQKNLLVITPSYPNYDNTYIREIFVKTQLDALKKYFNQIFVICPVLYSNKLFDKDKLCSNYSYDNVVVYYPRCYYIPIFCFKKILIDNRLKVVEKLIKKENIDFDIIHAHFTWPSAYIGVKLKKRFGTPVVVTIHENTGWFHKEVNINHPLLNYAWKNADALIRVNKKDVSVLKKFNENSFSIPNGFSSKFEPLNQKECRESLGLSQNVKILFTLGWLIERKGFNYLIEAMDIILKERKNVCCFIGGSGKLKDKLQRQINDLKLEKYVKLIGFIPDEALPLWMNACDIFVLPSLSESFGVVLIEAMACGKPVITTYNGGSEEVVISEDYGYLIEPKKSKKLAQKILFALDQSWDSIKIINYSELFSWDIIAEKIIEVYSDVLKNQY
ncbi:glycosyl transferase family 1 [Methanosarcina spelaei]|uniref:Glycosyl transferase family 1 n=1 Tax=Methanosarcina spelaei TaxID=1036679 RepID=A0A2A2HXU4_9EURY|nr:glycosyltransferase family 4 protein [Methanosarcina spelaei]PAV14116.1 glycosyl transferase family 1 [Methanosarcina spelaei]